MKQEYTRKVRLILLGVLFLMVSQIKAQNYVTIPDSNFVKYLKANFGACMNGNKMDTSCAAIKNEVNLYLASQSIRDLTGIEYFSKLQYLDCFNNLLKSIPSLDHTHIQDLSCSYNQLESLPSFASTGMVALECDGNLLTALPVLPSTLCSLSCEGNKLTILPELKNMLFVQLHCGNNNISCLPPLPPKIQSIRLLPNPFKCLPNYISRMDATLLSYPICKDNDPAHNPSGCAAAVGVSGYVYKDANNNCKKDIGEFSLPNVVIKLYNDSNQVVDQTTTFFDGKYQFLTSFGNPRIEIDTAGAPFQVQCAHPGDDSVVVLTTALPWVNDVNFGVVCKPENDFSVKSVTANGIVFPGMAHQLIILAGNADSWNNLKCTNGISGQVKVTIAGPVTYAGIPSGALTPSISGNVYTYTVPDFGAIDFDVFRLFLKTNTNATANDNVCVNVVITSAGSDKNPGNDKYDFCYAVRNSFDPNIKEVYPFDIVNEGYKDWFTYTIHFQNTGNAPAMNIILTDTLDAKLDFRTVQVLNYSHHNLVTSMGNALEFKFPNIQLADSTSDPEGSKGFVQYRVKPKANLLVGTTIKNKAFIYFDYNAPIVTNTTINHCAKTVSVTEDKENVFMHIYPNPSNGQYFLELNQEIANAGSAIEVYNLLGSLVYNGKITTATTLLDLSRQPNGVYFIKVRGADQSYNQRLIKQ